MSEVRGEPGHDTPTLLTPRVLIPFVICTLIWGSTWIVIRGQLGEVPVAWSVAYRFFVASSAMFAFALWKRKPLGLTRGGHGLAMLIGLTQFVGNFNFVYRAEQYVTSGLVAVLFALLIVPNTLLSRVFLGSGLSRRFLVGAGIAICGVALMILREYRAMALAGGTAGGDAVLLGIGLTLAGVLAASIANVTQGSRLARAQDMAVMLAWAMLYGAMGDAAYAWITTGPPVIATDAAYLGGVLYLGIFASAVAFPLYFGIIREVGPGQAAWSSMLVPIIAMLISTAMEGYRWTPNAIIGGVLAFAGLAIALKARPARPVVSGNMTPVAVEPPKA